MKYKFIVLYTMFLLFVVFALSFGFAQADDNLECEIAPGRVRINEVYPFSDWVFNTKWKKVPAWVEIKNLTYTSIPLTGCVLDNGTGGGDLNYTFGDGDYVPADGFFVFWCFDCLDPDGETLRLHNGDGYTISIMSHGVTEDYNAWCRNQFGWVESTDLTKGTNNTCWQMPPLPLK